MSQIEKNMRVKTRVNKVLVYVRLTREQILKIEHFALKNEIDVSEAHRQLLERGFDVQPSIPPNPEGRLFYEHRVKWIDPDGKLELNLEPEGETNLEKEIRVSRQAEEEGRAYRDKLYFDKFGPNRRPNACATCGQGEPEFEWYTADEPHWGKCRRGHRSYIQDYFKAGTADEDSTG